MIIQKLLNTYFVYYSMHNQQMQYLEKNLYKKLHFMCFHRRKQKNTARGGLYDRHGRGWGLCRFYFECLRS